MRMPPESRPWRMPWSIVSKGALQPSSTRTEHASVSIDYCLSAVNLPKYWSKPLNMVCFLSQQEAYEVYFPKKAPKQNK